MTVLLCQSFLIALDDGVVFVSNNSTDECLHKYKEFLVKLIQSVTSLFRCTHERLHEGFASVALFIWNDPEG